MEVVIVDRPELVMADIIAEAIEGGASTLGLATGSSPLATYTELIRRHRENGLSFAGVDAVLLDEYVGLPPTHPESYARFIRDNFTDHIDIGTVHSPDGMAPDFKAAAEAYDALIGRLGPVDVQILGIGSNGHIGFNEPSSSLTSRTRIKTLTEKTRQDNARFFDSFDEVPMHVITQGLGTICDAERLALVATGEGKADAIAAAVEGPLSASCPASILQWHRHATVVIDPAAASKLADADYYKYVYAHKP
ncbi:MULTISPECIES: glucosamine-6-phosphate deaminase [Gordonia]|uniref:Glucosamine-6-phosphate deaminase n=2 Tax=Gordonia TaxID=2053 RepID=L7LM48_9ACTN|nr:MULTISPECIES: glucosamine-6-phosphate deaminase [Gordonia]AUH69586.1 glucosamine-6-phosphate deaminase [Gordonia sp. YC-JH1]KJR08741.1 glucosamine-6-phosphate deaminase [Gordonia sihwensis]KXT57406.1 glucosamine-6-phosphate deaminase [Gordonia sp. QH-12]MBY4569410.1 glucosamine-6-phosphate deaminase [Gordonia sihwensis]GAC61816.1 glucosamine-6-phosphate deaminase [Gordonia sihwensis NBRC 108236]